MPNSTAPHPDKGSDHELSSTERALGLSCMFVVSGDPSAMFVYASESLKEILGYDNECFLEKSSWTICHPHELDAIRAVHIESLLKEKTGCLMYMRMLHQDGYFVDSACSYSHAFDLTVGILSRAISAHNVQRLEDTSTDVHELRIGMGSLSLGSSNPPPPAPATASAASTAGDSPDSRARSMSENTPPPQALEKRRSPPAEKPVDEESLALWAQLASKRLKRTAFLLDRFTEHARVMYVTNDLIVNNSAGVTGQTFYSVVKPSDRARVRAVINEIKHWSPVVYDQDRAGGNGYLQFHVLKIPDFPPKGTTTPQGTDATERVLPGQEFILVEGTFQACSDGIVCVIGHAPTDGTTNRAEDLDVHYVTQPSP